MLVFDIETNGLLKNVSVGHCIAMADTVTGKRTLYEPKDFQKGVRVLQDALDKGEILVAHNGISYDIPAIEKLYPNDFHVAEIQRSQIIDTYIYSMLLYSNIGVTDNGRVLSKKLPANLSGSHKLMAWGYRLGVLKGHYGEQENAWEKYTPEMGKYCLQDVEVTVALLQLLLSHNVSKVALDLEMQLEWLLAKMNRNGFPFDMPKALELERVLRVEYAKSSQAVITAIPTIPDKWDDEGKPIPFIPKRDNKTRGYKKGVPVFKTKDFNINSRMQVEWVIRNKYGYSPNYEELYADVNLDAPFNPSDYRLKIDEDTFKYLKDDVDAPQQVREFAPLLERTFILKKRLGQLADGGVSWFKCYDEDDQSIHGRVIGNGAVSGRAAHSSPNVAQVPKVGSLYGEECRELWHSNHMGNKWVQAGIDASGLELRCLAHYMSPYDDGAYANEVVHGDIHTANQNAAGLPKRDNAKTFNKIDVYKTIENGEILIN